MKTCETFGMSRPREATLVATRILLRPRAKAARVLVRCDYVFPPCRRADL